ncbi:MAG: hypothetical protein K9M17_07250 [Mariprofundaceae bacterium]|nr:hypothetical protein [Mariprofundaceae bacterium]
MSDSPLQDLIEDESAMRLLIGRRVNYIEQAYVITDYVPDEDLIILSADGEEDHQEDSYGRTTRLVPKQQELRFRDAEGHPTNIWEELSFVDGPLQG